MSSYVPLWCKANFSFLEGGAHPEELVAHAQSVGIGALAISDRDGVQGIVRAYVAGPLTPARQTQTLAPSPIGRQAGPGRNALATQIEAREICPGPQLR